MESLNKNEKINNDTKVNKNFFRNYSLINQISESNFYFMQNVLINKHRKKSHDFNTKRININDIDVKKIIKRKFTKENISSIQGFAPKIKPIKNQIIPSKLILNKNENKLLNSSKSFTYVPNSEGEDIYNSSQESFPFYIKKNYSNNFDKNNIENYSRQNIKEIRKHLIKNKKKKIEKSSSVHYSQITQRTKSEILNLDDSSGGSYLNEEEYDEYLSLRKDFTCKKENIKDQSNIFINRTNSMSILELLEKKFKLDDK